MISSITSITLLLLAAQAQAQAYSKPRIQLPWGSYEATTSNTEAGYHVFQNVRFGKSPTGPGRFNLPSFPDPVRNPMQIRDEEGHTCFQIDTFNNHCEGAAQTSPKSSPAPLLGKSVSSVTEGEDCLFLDIYVPDGFKPGVPDIPVIVWFYGGGFMFGTKDQDAYWGLPDHLLYSGDGFMAAAKSIHKKAIYVVGNYRLGAFGWLAGKTMEQHATQHNAVPNAGLHDQRLVLQFVQQYIHLLGGDKNSVSVWAESAGAGSVLHHLVANWSQTPEPSDPLFQRVFLQSPSYQWQWDNSADGVLEATYNNFTNLAECSDLTCLQQKPAEDLAKANRELYDITKCTGKKYTVAAVDGKLIKELPIVTFSRGFANPYVDSLIVSHVQDESIGMAPDYVKDEAGFQQFLEITFPGPSMESARQDITSQYSGITDPYKRAAIAVRDFSFTCNCRQLLDVYNAISKPVYLMSYRFAEEFGIAVHTSDLIPLFWRPGVAFSDFSKEFALYDHVDAAEMRIIDATFPAFARAYQNYVISHAVSGNPNKYKVDSTKLDWPAAVFGDTISDVLSMNRKSWYLTTDDQDTAEICDFWAKLATEHTVNVAGQKADENRFVVQQDPMVDL